MSYIWKKKIETQWCMKSVQIKAHDKEGHFV